MTSSTVLVALDGITKSFGGTRALHNVSFEIRAGEVMGLVGENGAGKSTLAKIIAGLLTPDSGEFQFEGEIRSFKSPHEALQAGVSLIAQEILLVPNATVEENVLLGKIPSRGIFPDRKEMRRMYDKLVEFTGFNLNPSSKVSSLRLADQQKVEVLRALSGNSRLIIMDEPSSSLTADEVERLHETIRKIASGGTTILLVSHFLGEILSLTDSVTIMRDGEVIRSGPTRDENVESLVNGMVGKSVATHYEDRQSIASKKTKLEVRNLSRGEVLKNVSFSLYEGEILGLVGLVGSGRTEIARSIYGADKMDSGEIYLGEKKVEIASPRDAIEAGIFMIPENRKQQGLFMDSSISNNLLISSIADYARMGFLKESKLAGKSKTLASQIDLRFATVQQKVGLLSGGNQQKILFGRARTVSPQILIVDEPTRGVDIAAKREIHKSLLEMVSTGVSLLFISSEIEEALGVCDRVLVIHKGAVYAEFKAPFKQRDVVAAFFGHGAEEE